MGRFEGRYITGQLSDRRYDTDGMAEFLRGVVNSGVLGLEQNLQVEAAGANVRVWPGKAFLNGYLVKIVGDDGFLWDVPVTAGACVYRVVLRQDGTGLGLGLKQGTESAPPSLERSELVYEISLAKVSRSAEGVISVTDEREDEEVCGVCEVLPDRLPPLPPPPPPLDLLNLIHPVGTYYMANHNTSPAELFGGTWERILDRFLWGCTPTSTMGATGGARTHVLSVDEMPSHRHNVEYAGTSVAGYGFVDSSNARSSNMKVTSFTGGNAAHNNMPPFINTAIWRRTA